MKKKILNFAGKLLLPLLINLYIKTLKIRIYNQPKDLNKKIFIFWHGKMFIGWWIFKNSNFSAMVSQSEDGEILSKILSRWKYKLIRASSSKDGKEGIKELISDVGKNSSAVITPDGPRGPAKSIKNGALIISKETRAPIIPVKVVYFKKKVLIKSWDKFEIPKLFSTCYVFFGNKYYYRRFLYEDDLANFKREIASQM
ncbi:MAG: DUF374 domain-containing protein [Ignavibacteria bacterium]|nr:DUF374 domain-containing protein [Ignavibacteria bacterium]